MENTEEFIKKMIAAAQASGGEVILTLRVPEKATEEERRKEERAKEDCLTKLRCASNCAANTRDCIGRIRSCDYSHKLTDADIASLNTAEKFVKTAKLNIDDVRTRLRADEEKK